MLLYVLKRTFKLGIKSLWLHRLRSTLTTLGIVFGVCSVIAMLAIGEGASREAQDAIKRLGSTNLIIETIRPPEERADTGTVERVRKYGLTYTDAESIRNTIPGVEVIVPIREIDQEALYLNRPKAAIRIIGTVPWYTEISPIRLIRGRFLSSTDLQYLLSVCVIDEGIARQLFLFDDPIGLDLRIFGNYYRVVGIVSRSTGVVNGGFNGTNSSAETEGGGAAGNVYMPLTTARHRFTEYKYTFSGGSRSRERVELQKITVKVGSIERVLAVCDVVDSLLSRLHEGKKDYRIIVPLELLREAARTRRIFSIVLGSIAAISLLVGGIGIMNIMLATVSERTREIGIRRALGARKHDIIVQFLSETLLLTLIGGVLGIVMGCAIPSLVTRFSDMPTVVTGSSLVLSFGISATVGIIFGLYPAWRAANMDPIESLRHE